ncbi:hypothetical protein P8C59_007196 [Phyllachora maydis]|uniref:RRM domain-containing protein n=1 Tax=Phyllachora maydis TaxID=1825666 RepID=A0AAD9I9S2_9PEZI|nr:hypothetical protein P8C59_007196 [Phyllachora maydis]
MQKEDLRTALYMLFSTYGPVLDVVALKTDKMRGQAHIVYRDINTATQALRSLQKFEFLGREMRIEYAKSKSNVVAKLDGTFKIPVTSSAAAVEVTDLQATIFGAPAPGSAAPAVSAPKAPAGKADELMKDAGTPESRGVKRTREEDEGSDSDVAMEEDSDEE